MLITGVPHEPQPESCDYVLSQDGLRPSLQGTSAPADWPKNGPVIAVLPATRLSWHRIKLPPLPKSQRLTAVIGLLEDQWLQAPGTLHISLHPIPEAEPDQDNHWVCTCDAAWLLQAMQPLIQAGRTPQRLVPEFAPVLAGQAETLDVIGPADAPLGVWCRPQGVLWTPMPCPWPLLQATPIQVRAEPALLQVASTVAKSAESIHTQTRSERWLQAVARPWDLAQGAWSQTPGQKAWRKLGSLARSWAFGAQWRRARWAGATLIASQCLGLLTWSWFMSQELAQQKIGRAHV
mgnify:FL=1